MEENRLSVIDHKPATINDKQIAIALGSYTGKIEIMPDSNMTEEMKLPLTAAIITETRSILLNLKRDKEGNFPWEDSPEQQGSPEQEFCLICGQIPEETPIYNSRIYKIDKITDDYVNFQINVITNSRGEPFQQQLSFGDNGTICNDCLDELTPLLHDFLEENKSEIVTRQL